MIEEILEYNRKFVEEKRYEPYMTSKYPDKKIAILTCMDTRLTELLPAALGLKNGDVKMIKNAGGVITHSLRKCGKKSACRSSGAWRGRGNGDWPHRLWGTGNGPQGIVKKSGRTWH